MADVRRRRFPRSVYDVGSDPDARFSLANERTMLAGVRTSLALVATGVALEAFAPPLDPSLRRAASITLLAVGTALPGYVWFHWAQTERAMRRRESLPAPGPIGLGVLGALVAGLLLLVGVALA